MEFSKVTVTFAFVDEILRCDHSNESSPPVLSYGAFCFSKFMKMKFGRNLPLTTFGIERVKTSIFLTMSINVHKLCLLIIFSCGRLQDGVPQTIEALRMAGIKVSLTDSLSLLLPPKLPMKRNEFMVRGNCMLILICFVYWST